MSSRGLIQFKLWKYDIRWTSASVGFTKKKKTHQDDSARFVCHIIIIITQNNV